MIRSVLGIESFGVNAWRATEAGQQLIGEHDELGPGSRRSRGAVRRRRAGERRSRSTASSVAGSARARSCTSQDPATRRSATADEAGTTVLVIGGTPRRARSRSPRGSAPPRRCASGRRGSGTARSGCSKASSRGSRERGRALQPRVRGEPRRPLRRRARSSRSRRWSSSRVSRAGADGPRSRRDSRRRAVPADGLTLRPSGHPAAGRRAAGRRAAERSERRHRIMVRARDEQHGAVLGAGERADEQLETDGERERLVRERAAERDELLGRARPASTSPWVTAPIETSATTGSPSLEGIAIASGLVPVNGVPPSGWGEARAARSPSGARRARALGKPAHPVAERAGREAARRDDRRARSGGCGDQVVADRLRASGSRAHPAVPAVETGPRGTLRAGRAGRSAASRATGSARSRDRACRAARRRRSGQRASPRRACAEPERGEARPRLGRRPRHITHRG